MAQAQTLIAEKTLVRGRIEGAEDLLVEGQVLGGPVSLSGSTLTIAEKATVAADVTAQVMLIDGIFVGKAVAEDAIELRPTARVLGDLHAPHISIQDGALIRGLVDTGLDVELPAPAQTRPAARPASHTEPRRNETRPAIPPRTLHTPARPQTAAPKMTSFESAAPSKPAEPANEQPEPD